MKRCFDKKHIIQSCLVFAFCVLLLYSAMQQPKGIELYFVRHGETNTNVEGLLVGTSGNPELTENGIQMAITLGIGLKDIQFDAAYASTLKRAYDTAYLVLQGAEQEKNVVITQVDGLKDISWGDAEGITMEELSEIYGISSADESFGSVQDENFVSPIHAETKYEFCERFEQAVSNIVETHEDGEKVLVVAHSSMDFYFQKYFPEQAGQGLNNASVTIVKYDSGRMELIEYNSTEYLQNVN